MDSLDRSAAQEALSKAQSELNSAANEVVGEHFAYNFFKYNMEVTNENAVHLLVRGRCRP